MKHLETSLLEFWVTMIAPHTHNRPKISEIGRKTNGPNDSAKVNIEKTMLFSVALRIPCCIAI